MENRAQPRFEVSLTAHLPGTAAHHQTRISDLSEGGCYVDSIAEVTAGEIIQFKILGPAREWLELEGAVAYVSSGLGFGLKFLNLNEHQSRAIHAFIKLGHPSPPHEAPKVPARRRGRRPRQSADGVSNDSWISRTDSRRCQGNALVRMTPGNYRRHLNRVRRVKVSFFEHCLLIESDRKTPIDNTRHLTLTRE
jgi:hypothetical protein